MDTLRRTNLSTCCSSVKNQKREGFIFGVFYGLIPHTFCILFIVFSVMGTTSASFLFKDFLLNRNFFYYLIILSFIFSTISAIFYLKKNGIFSASGIKRSWQYLLILYATTITVNLILFLVIFPMTANFSRENNSIKGLSFSQSMITLSINIPCSGHASLITGELKKLDGIAEIKFHLPNLFDVYFDPNKTSEEQILNLEVFKAYQAKIISK